MDFFISYNKADREWAEWIAWQLEEAGYSTNVQAWDFRPGSNFVLEMQRAASEAERTIAVLSPDYLEAKFTQPEWAAAFAKDPTGAAGILLPVRVRKCDLEGLLPQIVYIDLVGLVEVGAREKLLTGVRRGRAKPSTKPGFPGSGRAAREAPRFPGALPDIWNLAPRNPNFTGREDQLRDLHAALTADRAAAIVPIAGLGGAGKTQLALEYAWRHTADYEIVWWMRADDPATLAGDYAALAANLGVEDSPGDQQATVAAVRSWLAHHPGWLLIFDNAGSAADCRDYLPGSAGHVLATSRDPNWRGVAEPLRLPVLPRAEAIAFLHKRSGQDEPAAAGELCKLLGDLPLAIEHAGAYIESAAISVAEYLKRYVGFPGVLLGPVAATWAISVDRLRTEAPAALDLLHLVAFLAPDDIDPELVARHFPAALEFDQARAALRRYSLIDARPHSLAVHSLVQQVTRERLAREGEEKKWAETALELVNNAFPFQQDVVETWSSSAGLLPHALSAATHSERLGVALESTGRLLNGAGLYLLHLGQLGEAEQVAKRALAIAEKVYGPDHPNVASYANNIGQILQAQGDLAGALRYTQRALAIDEKVYGPDHPNVATDANNIGQILQDQGDLAVAVQYIQRAHRILHATYGPDNPLTKGSSQNLAIIQQALAKQTGS